MRSVLPCVLVFTLLAQPLVAHEIHPAAHANPAITVNVDAAANRHPIDPRIYGASWASAAQIAALGLTLNRWGGARSGTPPTSTSRGSAGRKPAARRCA